MFDWDDEELVNVIWDKASENEDHIVPYPNETYEKPPGPYGDHSKVSVQDAANVKLTEKTPVSITNSRVGSNINYDTHGRVLADGFGSLPDLSPSNATKLDLEHTDEKAQVDDGSQIFDNQPEDRDASNFVDYGWANVGSFDDLDRMLSNNDLVYGDVNISNVEALWSSHKDVIGCPEKSELLSMDSPNLQLRDIRSDSEHDETRPGFKDENHTNDNHGKTNDQLCQSMLGANTCSVNLEYGGDKNENLPKEKSASEIVRRTPPLVYPIGSVNAAMPDKIATGKMGEQRKSLRCQKMERQKSEARRPQTSCGPWFSLGSQGKEFEGQYRQDIKYSSSKARNQQTESSPYKQFIHRLPPSPGYNIMENLLSSVPPLPQFHSEEYQQVPSGSSDKTPPTPLMPMSMTPQEKIEKLRRRQQMRALLAIRKQQQQFRHQVSCKDYSNFVEIDESLGTLMSVDASSPLEQSDSDTMPMMMDKSTLEDTILHQLENVIARLDIQIRLCIRDSLFRLAHSALQRRYDGETVSTNRRSRDEPSVIVEERFSTKSSTRTPEGETKTNPVDRAVVHLLFHAPPELSGEYLQSSSSAKLCSETATTSKNFPMRFLNGSYEDKKLKISCMDGSEKASDNETAGGSGLEIEASS